jgi:hypothetical protein
MNKEEEYQPRPKFFTEEEKLYQQKMDDASDAIMSKNIDQEQLENFEKEILDQPPVPESQVPEPQLPEPVKPEPLLPESQLPESQLPEPVKPELLLPEPQLPEPVKPEEQVPVAEPQQQVQLSEEEENMRKNIRNLTRKDCNLFVDILQNKYSGRPMRQTDDEPDKTDMYQDAYTLSNGNFYNDNDNLTVNKLKQSNFNMTIIRDSNLLEEYDGPTQKLITNLLNDPNAPRMPLTEEMLKNIQFSDRRPPIVENDLNMNVILFEVLDKVSNEMSQINKIFLNKDIIYDEDIVKSIIDKENFFNKEDSSMKRGASYYKYLTQLQENVVNEEYRTKDNVLHKIYDKLNEVTSNMPNDIFNKYFIDIMSILIFFSDLTVNKLTQKIMNMFNVSENDILFKFVIARVIYGPNGNPIIDVSQLGEQTYREELLSLSQNTKKMSQIFGIDPSEVKNKLFTNTVEIFMEQNTDIIINKTFTSVIYLDDNIYSLTLFKYTWNLNKNTCTVEIKYRWVINDMKILKLIGDYTKILTDLLKITEIPVTNFKYQFLKSENNYYNFKSYIINCIKILKCVIKGDVSKELNDKLDNELDYSSSNQKIEGKLGQKMNQIKERYDEIKEDNPKKMKAAKVIGSVGTAVGLGVAGLSIAGIALSSVLGGKTSKKNMKRRSKRKITRNHKKKKKNTRRKTRKGIKKAKKIRNTKKQICKK